MEIGVKTRIKNSNKELVREVVGRREVYVIEFAPKAAFGEHLGFKGLAMFTHSAREVILFLPFVRLRCRKVYAGKERWVLAFPVRTSHVRVGGVMGLAMALEWSIGSGHEASWPGWVFGFWRVRENFSLADAFRMDVGGFHFSCAMLIAYLLSAKKWIGGIRILGGVHERGMMMYLEWMMPIAYVLA